MYKNINSNDWQKLELKKEGELTYTGNINLLYDNDYQYKIIVKGDKSKSSDIEDLHKLINKVNNNIKNKNSQIIKLIL